MCWTPKGIHLERINKDPSVFFSIEPKLKMFFTKCILPVILDIDATPMLENAEDDNDELYCFCQQKSFGRMVGCDNQECPFGWFHFDCVGIIKSPDSETEWYCDHCKA